MTTAIDKKTVLVVDDAAENIDVLAGLLKAQYKVKVAKDGERALKVAAKSPHPDVILLDVMMPGMDGYEVCEKLKADAETAHIPVVFVTGMESDADREKGLGLGAVGYLAKPVEPDEVMNMVAKIVA